MLSMFKVREDLRQKRFSTLDAILCSLIFHLSAFVGRMTICFCICINCRTRVIDLFSVFTWRHGRHLGAPKQRKGGHVGAPTISSEN